jgi:predicted enzyme related to lactoylglutathione lyase
MAEDRPHPAGVLLYAEPDRVDALAAFYREVLRLPARTSRPGFQSFEWGDFRLTITGHDAVRGTTAEPFRVMVNFAVTDIQQAYRRLQAAGVPFVRPPEREDWGGIVATLQDPDGNLVQLFQLPER